MKISRRILMVVSMFSVLSGCYGNCGLTDEGVIRKAVEFYLKERQPGVDDFYESNGFRYKRYQSFEEFIAINPDCCRLERLLPEWGTVPLRHTIWYGYRGTVYINSLHQRVDGDSIDFEDDDDRYFSPYDLIVPVSNCGRPLMFLTET